jgi:hypothetical protein
MNSRLLLSLLSAAALAVTTASAESALSDLTKTASPLTGQPAGESKLPGDIVSGLQGLASTFSLSQLNYASLAKDALSALNVNQGSKALASLDKIGAAKLTAGQLSAFKTAKTAVDAYVLQHNFSGVPAVNSLLTDSLAMIKSGDFAGVVGKLQAIAANVKPTAEQKGVLDSLVAYYQGLAAKK